MINIEINNNEVLELVKNAICDKVDILKSDLQVAVTASAPDSMDMPAITTVVMNINSLNDVCDQIDVKKGLGGGYTNVNE